MRRYAPAAGGFNDIDTLLTGRRNASLRYSFIFSIALHIVLIIIPVMFAGVLEKKKNTEIVFYVEPAGGSPVPATAENAGKGEEPVTVPPVPETSRKSDSVVTEAPRKSDFRLPDKNFKSTKKPDYSWREASKKISEDVGASRQKAFPGGLSSGGAAGAGKLTISSGAAGLPGTGGGGGSGKGSSDALAKYVNGLRIAFRNNWNIPGDLARKFRDYSSEIEIALSGTGEITNVRITRSSGDGRFDRYAKDAVIKTGRIPLPPKEILDTMPVFDKITLEFKP